MAGEALEAAPDARPAIGPGTVIAGRFQVVKRIGEGGMGAVYEVVQTSLGRRVALKLLHPEVARLPGIMARFDREARLLAGLRHPNIVEVIDAGVADGALFVAMELLDGEALSSWIEARGMPVSLGALLPWLEPIGRALDIVHAQGVVHRDVKPDNVFLARGHDGTVVPKLLDFGVAHASPAEAARLTTNGVILGTPAYMAPEQAWGAAELSPAADQWAFAAMLYEALTAHLPHEADNPQAMIVRRATQPVQPAVALNPGLDVRVSAVLDRALDADPKARFASVGALLDALAPLAQTASAPTVKGPPPSRSLAISETLPDERAHPGVTPLPSVAPSVDAPPAAIAPANAPAIERVYVAPSEPVTPPPPRRWRLALGLAAGLGAAIVVATLATRAKPSTPVGRARQETVTFIFDFSPSSARIMLDGEELGAGHAARELVSDGRSHALRVEADGFLPYHDALVANASQRIARSLVPRVAGAPVVPQTTPTPAHRVVTPTRVPVPARPALRPGQRPHDTDYPE